jgi:hypothetical protein
VQLPDTIRTDQATGSKALFKPSGIAWRLRKYEKTNI